MEAKEKPAFIFWRKGGDGKGGQIADTNGSLDGGIGRKDVGEREGGEEKSAVLVLTDG